MRELQAGCDILCATLGRLKHFIESEQVLLFYFFYDNLISGIQVLLTKLKYLVLDEVDVLLDNDFLNDIRSILRNVKFPPVILKKFIFK